MELRNVALFVLIFSLGVVSASLIYEFGKITSEQPLNVLANPVNTVVDTFDIVASGRSVEKSSPADHVRENQIRVYNDRVELDLRNAIWSKFTDSNSMDPFLDEGANGIEIVPKNETQIKIGDIISYESKDGIIVHRVISIGNDSEGKYFIVKGDNNPVQDPNKVRFEQIKGILVGIIY